MRKDKKKHARQVAHQDTPPPERQAHDVLVSEPADIPGHHYKRVATQRQCDRLWRQEKITQRQRDAAEKLYRTFTFAVGEPDVTMSYNDARAGGIELEGDVRVKNRQAYYDAIQAIRAAAGLRTAQCVESVTCFDFAPFAWARAKSLASCAGLQMLQDGLDVLARHYRL